MTASASALADRDRDLLFGRDGATPGDAVVHIEHGLARYEGEVAVEVEGETQRLHAFGYREGGRLMLPAEEGRDFWRHGAPADEVTLDRLDAGDWLRRRDAMIAELRESADRLAAQIRDRRAHAATPLRPDAEALAAFAEGFGHDATDDQTRAVDAVLADMARDRPMDRLLIGDVGFGKTEVALRAAAAAALSGRQAVIAAPTTVLARQHADAFRARFDGTGVAVAELSRLTPAAERDGVLADIASGAAAVVVGTQALLAEDVTFADLALVVIDEEQKFGREQKDALRDLCPGCHLLTMTATPIPRSLAAAEVGLLDVSILATPPGARRPVETRVVRAGPTAPDAPAEQAREAIAAELARGGQAFVVCPRIEGLEEAEALVASAASAHVVAHGDLPEADLEERMLDFMRGEVDVLLSTTIIENGLHNPRANTMVVFDADRFGLAQLHQLRGRIGRGDAQARMLLLTDTAPPSEDEDDGDHEGARRLDAFAALSGIGDGFRIARRDRDMRGFGHLDGDDQSGHASRLGIGLYRHVLREWMAEADQRAADAPDRAA